MSTAFLHFSEPMAWLIRGLLEYGWSDITRTRIPTPGTLGGLDLSYIPESQGKAGIILLVPAVADGSRCHEDETYSFEVVLQSIDDGDGFAVRCAEANFIQEFAFDPDNPTWAAGYIHQALSEYVPNFVRWRLGGGELTWAQRQGVPEVHGNPCSASLATWIEQQLSGHRTIDMRLWTGPTPPAAPVAGAAPVAAPGGPVARVGRFAAPAGSDGQTSVTSLVKRPAQMLDSIVYMGSLSVGASVINVLLTLYLFKLERMFAVVTNLGFIVVFGSLSVGAWFGVRQYRKVEGKILPWVAMAYAALIPTCCLVGLPVAAWAAKVWMSPDVKAARTNN